MEIEEWLGYKVMGKGTRGTYKGNSKVRVVEDRQTEGWIGRDKWVDRQMNRQMDRHIQFTLIIIKDRYIMYLIFLFCCIRCQICVFLSKVNT